MPSPELTTTFIECHTPVSHSVRQGIYIFHLVDVVVSVTVYGFPSNRDRKFWSRVCCTSLMLFVNSSCSKTPLIVRHTPFLLVRLNDLMVAVLSNLADSFR